MNHVHSPTWKSKRSIGLPQDEEFTTVEQALMYGRKNRRVALRTMAKAYGVKMSELRKALEEINARKRDREAS